MGQTLGILMDSFLSPSYTGSNHINFNPVMAVTTITGSISNGGFGASHANSLTIVANGQLSGLSLGIYNMYVNGIVAISGKPTAGLPGDRGCGSSCYEITASFLPIQILEDKCYVDLGWFGCPVKGGIFLNRLQATSMSLGSSSGIGLTITDAAPDPNTIVIISNPGSDFELGVSGMKELNVSLYRGTNPSLGPTINLTIDANAYINGTSTFDILDGWYSVSIDKNSLVLGTDYSWNGIPYLGDATVTGVPYVRIYGDAGTTPDSIGLYGDLLMNLSFTLHFSLLGLFTIDITIYYPMEILKPSDHKCLFGGCP